MNFATGAVALIAASLLPIGCQVVDSVNPPSVVDIAEEKHRSLEWAERIAPTVQALKPCSTYCREVMAPLEARGRVLAEAEPLAILRDSQTGQLTEQRNLQRKLAKWMTDFEQGLHECVRHQR